MDRGMKQPPSFQSDPSQGPAYDPMDRIVQDLLNIQSFLSYLSENPKDTKYFETHFSKILSLRKGLSLQLKQLNEEPYSYASSRLGDLQKRNEKIFSLLEGVAGAVNPFNKAEFETLLESLETEILQFDNHLTP